MNTNNLNEGIVSTILDRCKRCYSCIRECPAKAIRVVNGQAVVVSARCIGCGHCVKVCSQHAKQIETEKEFVFSKLLPNGKTAAIIAPSFAVSFPETYNSFPTALRKLGFAFVAETAFGADLISPLYHKEILKENTNTIISSACPAVFNYIEKYFEKLVPNLAGIVSPMIAMGKYLKSTLGDDWSIVFIGPCVAKKSEARDPNVEHAIDAVLTFTEIIELFDENKITLSELEPSEFDPPHAFYGKSYPLPGGLLKTADISDDILEKAIIVVEGKAKCEEIFYEIADNKINAKFIDILFCEGCISGPAIASDLNYYSKREKVINYIEEKMHQTDKQVWKSNLFNSRNLDLTRNFVYKHQRKPMPSEAQIKELLAKTNKYSKQDELNCGACGYKSCRENAIAIAKGLAEEEMCLPFLIEKLENAYSDLKSTQEQLHSAEKLASIGQLAAGVAHEINNPLGTILLYSSMLRKEIDLKKQNSNNHVEDLNLIIEETNRCKNIVSNLLNFARQGKLRVVKLSLDRTISGIIKSIKLKPEFEGITLNFENINSEIEIEADEDQVKQVLLNVINNACEAVDDNLIKKVSIRLTFDNKYAIIEIEDNGCGIPKENLNKLFTPFFTTKKIGKGTGLGLAITYGIVKMHKGEIYVNSKPGEGTLFTIKFPQKLNTSQIMID